MEWEEACGAVWETLAQAAAALSLSEIADRSCVDEDVLIHVMPKLIAAQLAWRTHGENKPGKPLYQVRLNLDAMGWAKAVEIGIGIDQLERFASLDEEGRQAALEIASDGTLERQAAHEKETRANARQAMLAGAAASKAATTDLARLVHDTKITLDRMRHEEAEQPDVPLKQRAQRVALEQAYEETSKALNLLVEQYQRHHA